VQWPK